MAIIDFKATKCRHCYKCVRNCEVKAIMVKDGRAEIMPDNCILCGRCLQICPQSAKTLVSDLGRVKDMIEAGEKVVVSIAPSYMGLLKYHTIGQVRCALMRLGFTDVRETAEGAALVTAEYARLLSEGTMENIISTCCPSVNALIEKYYPQLIPYLAPVVSPMIAHGRMIKQELGSDTKVVFLGPCIAKKQEALDPRHADCVDAVLNFNDISRWLNEEDIVIEDCEDTPFEWLDPRVNRLYPVTSGVINSVMVTEEKQDKYRKFYVHGESNCIDLCQSMVRGEITGCFIEMNMCSGGCIKGPTVNDKSISRFKVKLDMEERISRDPVPEAETKPLLEEVSLHKVFLDRTPKDPVPSEEEIRDILAKTGKVRPDDELNCGACGYNTCREKAIAIIQNKAEVAMCIPYMRAKQESYSNKVFNAMPGLLVTVDYNLKIIQMNEAASKLFNMPKKRRLIGKPVSEIMDDYSLASILAFERNLMQDEIYLEDQKCYLDRVMTNDKENKMILCIMKDITKERKHKDQIHNAQIEAARMADKLVEEQLKIVQQIAGLLGETAADTKVAVEKLKNTILLESEEENEKK